MAEHLSGQDRESMRDAVRAGYAKIAEQGVWLGENVSDAEDSGGCCGGGGCCGPTTLDSTALAEQIGYERSEIEALPDGANMGLSCGNPTAIAGLKAGETVVDLGSGGGFDIFLAGPKVGASGRAIGVDMTAEMVSKARSNVASYTKQTGLENVEFRLGEIEHLPLADASVDCVISNCVINLSVEKEQVYREIARALKPGGRVAVSDLALLKPLPEGVGEMVDALVGCIAGASLVEDVERMARDAGLVEISIELKPSYVDALTGSSDPLYAKVVAALPEGERVSDYVTSMDLTARKPG